MRSLRVLIGCEESGVVRDAFIARGHNAISCDLVPARNGGPHLRMDVIEAILYHGPWDIIILHPDCTAMAYSGNRWYAMGKPLYALRMEAGWWTQDLWQLAKREALIGCAIENPCGHLWRVIEEKPQYIQPWMFGHGETKKTGIATHNLPPLVPTDIVEGREQRIWKMPPGPNRKRDRSKTFPGIGEAMAAQWGDL